MTAPIKTCNYCRAVGVMPTFMNGETVCYDCLQTLPKTLLEAWREIASLRAKIEQMERQEPVGEIQRANSTGNYICSEVWVPLPVGSKLYALPGAQPKDEALWPTIANGMITPDGWKLVPIEPTPTMITAALESSHAINAHRAEYCYRAMLAAAPEAKP